MPAFPKVSNFKNSLHNIKINNVWKNVPQIYVKNNGNGKPLYSYSGNIGAGSGCSVTCGGGTQTRTVNCKRNDGLIVNDSICTTFVGSKPSTSQSCNTQNCSTCVYNCTSAPKTCGSEYFDDINVENGGTYSYRISVRVNGVTIAFKSGSPCSFPNSITSNGVTYTRGACRENCDFCEGRYEVCY